MIREKKLLSAHLVNCQALAGDEMCGGRPQRALIPLTTYDRELFQFKNSYFPARRRLSLFKPSLMTQYWLLVILIIDKVYLLGSRP